MRYFQTLPQLIITDPQRNSKVLTNLLARASVIQSLLKNPLIFYEYDIQDSDTPEIISHKYYGSVDQFWMVLFANEILDPLWDWPLTTTNFNNYINSKYTQLELYEVHHYEKIITKMDNISKILNTETIIIDEDTYNSLVPSTNTYIFKDKNGVTTGEQVTVDVKKQAIDNFQYELHLNESKRSIRLINKSYVSQIEEQFKTLMKA